MGLIMKMFNKLEKTVFAFAILGFLGANTLFCLEKVSTIEIELPDDANFIAQEKQKAKLLEELFEAEISLEKITRETEAKEQVAKIEVNGLLRIKKNFSKSAFEYMVRISSRGNAFEEGLTKKCNATILVQSLKKRITMSSEDLDRLRDEYRAKRDGLRDLSKEEWIVTDLNGEDLDFSGEESGDSEDEVFTLQQVQPVREKKLSFFPLIDDVLTKLRKKFEKRK